MKLKKRGISPLIATVLLIGFTIAIVAMIFIWWGDFVKQKAIKEGLKTEAERACMSYVDIDVKSVENLGDDELKFVINNRGSQRISGFRFRIKNDGVVTVLKKSEIPGVSQGTIILKKSEDGYGDDPTEAEVLPIVVKTSEEGSLAYTCTNQVTKIKIQ